LRQKIDRLKTANETGSADEILRARDDLSDELDNHPMLLSINNIEMAAGVMAREDPAKAPRYVKYLDDVRRAIERQDSETLVRLIEEIMPEVSEILDRYASKELRIWKGIRQ
jgi:hypothetical protein